MMSIRAVVVSVSEMMIDDEMMASDDDALMAEKGR
jgi:hypothetical protein